MRQKHTFLYHGERFFCADITVEDYLLITIDPEAGFEKILGEYNEKLPQLNARQSAELMRILFGIDGEKKSIMDDLTETEKQIRAFKEKDKKKIDKQVDDMLDDFHLFEGQLMYHLKQPLSELRSWPYQYFMKIYKDLAYCTGAKEYEKNRHSQKPDKKGFKSEFEDVYNK